MPYKYKEDTLSTARKNYHKNKKKTKDRRNELRRINRMRPEIAKKEKIAHWIDIGIIDEDLSGVYNYFILETNCMICNKEYNKSFKRCLDHDHDTGEIRYICCTSCNLHVVG